MINKIVEVTVYPNRALVSRQVEIDIKSDSESVKFEDLPGGTQLDTIRVSGQGDAEIKIEGIDTGLEYLDIIKDGEIRDQESELERLNDELDKINKMLVSYESEMEFLESIRDLSTSTFKSEFYCKKISSHEPGKLLNFFKDNIGKINAGVSDLEQKKIITEKKISKVESELYLKKSMRNREVINCVVQFNVRKEGKFSFFLSYVIDNAKWTPVYDARLLIDKNEVEISYYGEVAQETGEDWNDVNLFLSTARPSISATLPELGIWFVDLGSEMGSGISPGSLDAGSMPMVVGEEKADYETADLNKGFNVTFKIKDSQSLPPNGTVKKVLIDKRSFPIEIKYRAFPKYVQSAFITGSFTNDTDYPLLPGTVRVYHEQDYIGDTNINAVSASEGTTLSLGTDNSISVKREQLKHFTQKKGVTGGYIRTVYKYRIRLENFKKKEVEINVEEPIPLSQNKEIIVELEDVTDDKRADYQGVLKWELKLKPGEKKVIDIEYYVEYPKNRTLVGLEV